MNGLQIGANGEHQALVGDDRLSHHFGSSAVAVFPGADAHLLHDITAGQQLPASIALALRFSTTCGFMTGSVAQGSAPLRHER